MKRIEKEISLIDSHCHIHFTSLLSSSSPSSSSSLSPSLLQRYFFNQEKFLTISGIVLCGVSPYYDWNYLSTIISSSSFEQNYSQFLRPQFGLHPWWINSIINQTNEKEEGKGEEKEEGKKECLSWEDCLKDLLIRFPFAGVGECGIDKTIKKKVSLEKQKEIVRKHIEIAKFYNRPVTLHCVQSWGTLLSLLQEQIIDQELGNNVQFILHSCNSLSSELVTQYLQYPMIYFSFNGSKVFNNEQIQLARKIPHNRLLIESDSPDQRPNWILPPLDFNTFDRNNNNGNNENGNNESENATIDLLYEEKSDSYIIESDPLQEESITTNEPISILHACYLLSEALNVSPRYIAKITTENSRRVFWFN